MNNPLFKFVTLRMVINAGFALALIILLATQWMLYRTIHFMVNSDTWEKNTYVDINIYDRFLSSLKDIETGMRGYVITGDTTYLEPYYAGSGNLKTLQNSLRTLTLGNPIQQDRLTLIDSLVSKKLNVINELVELRRSNRYTTASVIAQSLKGKLIMDAIRQQVEESRFDEIQILNKSKVAKTANLHAMLSILIMSIIFVLTVLIAVFFILKKEIVQRMNAEQKLLKQQDYLNECIVTRTAELRETNDSLRNARRAALNMMEDAIAARNDAEKTGVLLKEEITERNKAEKDVRESEERFRIIAEKVSIGLVMAKQSDSRIVFANPAYHEMLGLRPGELLGQKGPNIYFDPKDSNALEGTLKKQGYLKDYAIQIRKRNSAPMWVLSTVQAIEYKGEPVLMGAYVDITDRKLAEEALRKSEQRLKFHLENSPLAVIEWDAEYIVTQWTREAEKMYGWTKEEVLGKPINSLNMIYIDDEPIVARTMEILSGGKQNTVVSTNRNYTKSGNVIECTWYNSVVLDEHGKMASVMSLVQDITERVTNERNRTLMAEIQSVLISSLSISETIAQVITIIKRATKYDAVGIRLHNGEDFPYVAQEGFSQEFILTESTLVSHTADGEICRDAHGTISLECTCGAVLSGHIDPANPLFTPNGSFWTNNSYPLLGLSADEDPRVNPRNLCIHNGFGSIALIPIRQNEKIIGLLHLNSSKTEAFTLPIINFYEQICEILGIALVGKQAKIALQMSEQSYRNQFVNNSAVMLLIDPENGAIIDANTAAINYYGYTDKQLLSMQISDINILPAIKIRAAITSVLKGFGKKFYFQHRLADGTLRDVEVSISRIQFGGRDILHSIIQDITDRKQAEESLRQSNAELDAFNYSVSHDLRGPLHIISMFGQLLVHDYGEILDEDGKIYIRHITQSTGRMTQIIDDMQKLSQISRAEIHCSYVNLSEIVRAFVREQYLYDVERDVEVAIADDIVVYADSGLMTIVMDNLCRNAWKFTSKQTHARIDISSESDGKNIVCCIRDNGVGFNMAQAEKLFMPFKRLHTVEEFPGTGIGLVIVRRIIERHGGRVWAEGEVDKGAAIYFELPIVVDNKETGGGGNR